MSKNKSCRNVSRRQFLGGAGAAAVGTAALVTPGVSQAATEAKVPRWSYGHGSAALHRLQGLYSRL